MHKNERLAEQDLEAAFQAHVMMNKISKLRSKVGPRIPLNIKHIGNCMYNN
jgi:hypothetical protein